MRTEKQTTSDDAVTARRSVVKGMALGAAAGVVWAAPRIEGLTVRPDYAAASSVAPGGAYTVTMRAVGFTAPLARFAGPIVSTRGCFSATMKATYRTTASAMMAWDINVSLQDPLSCNVATSTAGLKAKLPTTMPPPLTFTIMGTISCL